MVIGIDASRAQKKQRTGTEVHNAEIIKHLIAIDRDDIFRLYATKEPVGDMADLTASGQSQRIEWKVMPFFRGWSLFRLSLEMLFHPPDVLFIPAHILPIICPKKSVVMIHDIGFDHFRELYSRTDVWYHGYAVRFAARFAAHILTPSEFTRRDLHQKYGIPLKKMTAVHHGFDTTHFRPKTKTERSPIVEPYFYYVGRLEHKKNIVRMIEAFSQFKQKTGLPHKFLLAGRPAHGYDKIEQKLNALPNGIRTDIELLGYVPQDRANAYLRHAVALVFTTLFEGFGLPALEAFASGCPVIASRTTSLPEIVGDAALMVDPTSTEQITNAMINVATNPKLRLDLIKKGNRRYRKFSWEKAARETLAVLKKIGGVTPDA